MRLELKTIAEDLKISGITKLSKKDLIYKIIDEQAVAKPKNDKKSEGGGESKLLENGKVFDKVGVNFSEVYGLFPKDLKGKIPGTKKSAKFWASGISIVMHMKNPYIPAMHFNTRYIITDHGWFGGGMDFTPCFKDSALEKIVEKK